MLDAMPWFYWSLGIPSPPRIFVSLYESDETKCYNVWRQFKVRKDSPPSFPGPDGAGSYAIRMLFLYYGFVCVSTVATSSKYLSKRPTYSFLGYLLDFWNPWSNFKKTLTSGQKTNLSCFNNAFRYLTTMFSWSWQSFSKTRWLLLWLLSNRSVAYDWLSFKFGKL